MLYRLLYQNINPGQDTRAEPKLEGHRNQIEHSEGVMLYRFTVTVPTAKRETSQADITNLTFARALKPRATPHPLCTLSLQSVSTNHKHALNQESPNWLATVSRRSRSRMRVRRRAWARRDSN